MSNFATNNFRLERKKLEKLYFDKIQELSETHQVKNRPCTVTYVSLNNVPYLLYSYKTMGITLVPTNIDLINGDSDGHIISYGFDDKYGFHLEVIDMKDFVIDYTAYDMTNHSYITNRDVVTLRKSNFSFGIDKDELQEMLSKCYSVELLFGGRRYYDLAKLNQSPSTESYVVRTKDSTKSISTEVEMFGDEISANLVDHMRLIANDDNYKDESNLESMIDIINNVNKKELMK